MGALERALAVALAPWLRWRSRPRPLRAALEGLPYERVAAPPHQGVRVAVVQFSLELVPNAQAYARHAHEIVRQAVAGGADLVVFPEYASLPLLGLLPGAHALADSLARQGAQGEGTGAEVGGGGDYETMAMAFRLAAPAAARVYKATFSLLAARFHVLLLAGSLIDTGPDGRLRNVAYLFDAHGGTLARQVKTHLVPSEVAMGFAVGEELTVVSTRAGRLAFPVCMDHTYFETARIVSLAGADLLVDPSANTGYYDPYAQARGVWNRVQEAHTYGLLCSGVGRVAGIVFEGRSGVYAPLPLSPAGDGVLAEAQTYDREEIVFADLDYGALRAYRRQNPLEFNSELYRRYLPTAYGSQRGL